jgi:hypothetical protein
MYTLEELQSKTLRELKTIGEDLNVFPADRRRRQSWIEAIAGINPPLLQLLETSPGVESEPAQESLMESGETSSSTAEVEPVQEPPIESKFGRIVYPRPAQGAILQVAKTSPGVEEDDFAPECPECFDDKFVETEWGRIKPCRCSEPKLSRQKTQSAIAPAAKNLSSRSKTSTAHQLLELFKSSAHIIDSPAGETEQVSQSAIEQAAKNNLDPKPDLNPILTGIPLSDRFLARYSPPQSENIRFQLEADGQLSLLDFEIESESDPPDPDDFASIDAFGEALARWDAENAEMLAVSIDSMCEWAPCPEEWYEPESENLPLKTSSMIELPGQSEVMELSITGGSSSTSDFSIPTFGAWCDRQNGTDEPPDTGLFAKLPKPKPPGFPPQATWTQLGHNLDTGQPKSGQVRTSQPETIPKLFHCGFAGSSTQPARSPPGGDA